MAIRKRAQRRKKKLLIGTLASVIQKRKCIAVVGLPQPETSRDACACEHTEMNAAISSFCVVLFAAFAATINNKHVLWLSQHIDRPDNDTLSRFDASEIWAYLVLGALLLGSSSLKEVNQIYIKIVWSFKLSQNCVVFGQTLTFLSLGYGHIPTLAIDPQTPKNY